MKLKDELLADFIGERRKWDNSSSTAQQWNFIFCDGFYPTINTMKFHNDWQWMIPVCKKAKDVHYKIANGPRLYREIELALLTLDIQTVNKACLKFIEQYNLHQTKYENRNQKNVSGNRHQ